MVPLLATKLFAPPSRPDLVPRPHLIEQINRGLAGRLTLVSAPAGSGKTTLLSAWIGQTDDPVAWLSLDEEDDDANRFFANLIAALQLLDASVGEAARAALESPESGAAKAAVATLINDLAGLDRRVVLVLDDYHVIRDPAIREAMRLLVDREPPMLHLMITTRADPDLPLARLRARGQLTEIRDLDLRFREPEIGRMLESAGVPGLSAGDLRALAARTEGWIAGVQLAALSLRRAPDSAAFIRAFSGSDEYILDYLTDEVLQGQPAAVTDFLLATCILERLSAPLCDALTGRRDSQARLQALREANLFLIPLDAEGAWLRYHHLFADALRVRLRRGSPERLPALHERAARWYAANGFPSDAIHHSLAAGQYEQAAGLIEQVATEMLTAVAGYSQALTLQRWIDRLPEPVLRGRARLYLARGWALALRARTEADLRAVAEAVGRAEAAWAANPPGAESPAGVEMQGLLPALKAEISLARGDMPAAIAFARAALDGMPEEQHLVRTILGNVLGTAYWLSGQVLPASEAYEDALREAELASNVYFEIGGQAAAAEIEKERGRLRAARDRYQAAADRAVAVGWASVRAAGNLYGSLAEVLREMGRLDEAAALLERALRIAEAEGFDNLQLIGHIILARTLQAQGKPREARAAIEAALRLGQRLELMGMRSWAAAVSAWLHLAQGDLPAASRWAAEAGLDPDDQAASRRSPGEYAVLARVWIAEGKPAEALRLLDGLRADAAVLGRTGRVVEIEALRAVALGRLGQAQAAQGALAAALDLARPEGYVRAFADEGDPMRALLTQALRADPADAYVKRLLAAMPGGAPGADELLPEPLSEREVEVLRLMAAGLKNREIAERLVVVLGTVKAHINSIYGKLGVRNRVEAVARARALGLLE